MQLFQSTNREHMAHHNIKCGYVISKLIYLFVAWDADVLQYSS
jgi:hypothetical protein